MSGVPASSVSPSSLTSNVSDAAIAPDCLAGAWPGSAGTPFGVRANDVVHSRTRWPPNQRATGVMSRTLSARRATSSVASRISTSRLKPFMRAMSGMDGSLVQWFGGSLVTAYC